MEKDLLQRKSKPNSPSFEGETCPLAIKIYGNSCLRKESTPVATFDKRLEVLLGQMKEIMYQLNGVGLAAPQVGITQCLCVIDTESQWNRQEIAILDDEDVRKMAAGKIFPLYLINPQIIAESETLESVREGCLSVPKINGYVLRPKWVEVKYQDVYGKWHTFKADHLLGRCMQHEIDHLHGTFFTDRVSEKEKRSIKDNLMNLQKEYGDSQEETTALSSVSISTTDDVLNGS
jgi:peptide deformylase